MDSSIFSSISSVVSWLLDGNGSKPKPQNSPVQSHKPELIVNAVADRPVPVPVQAPSISQAIKPLAAAKPVIPMRSKVIEKTFLMGKNLKTTALVFELGHDCMFVNAFIKIVNTDHPDVPVSPFNFNRLLFLSQGLWQACPDINKLSDAIEANLVWQRCKGNLKRFGLWFKQFKAKQVMGLSKPVYVH